MAETGESQIQGLTRRVAVEAKQKGTIAGVALGVFPVGPVVFDTLALVHALPASYRLGELAAITAVSALAGGVAGRKLGTVLGEQILEGGAALDAKAGPFIDRFMKPPAAPVRVPAADATKPKRPGIMEQLKAKADSLRAQDGVGQ